MSAGFKVFTAGDVLTAADVNDYLMEQAVMVFDDAAARDTAIGTANFNEGMTTYNKDTAQLELYDGAAWVAAAPGDSGLIHIETQSISGVTSASFNDVFTSAYRNYRINFSGVTALTEGISLRLRAAGTDNSSSNYQYARLFAGIQASVAFGTNQNTTTTSHIFQANAPDVAGAFIDVFHPAITGKTSIISMSSGLRMEIWTTQLTVTTAYDGFTIFTGSNITGQISVYGYKD